MIAWERLAAPHKLLPLSDAAKARLTGVARFGLGALLGAGLGLTVFLSPLALTANDRLLPNVRIEGLEVGGCEASAIRTYLRNCLCPGKLWIGTPGRTWSLSLTDSGGVMRLDEAVDRALRLHNEGPLFWRAYQSWQTIARGQDLPVACEWDRKKLESSVRKIAWAIGRKPVNARLTGRGGKFSIVPGRLGRRLDVAATVDRVSRQYGVRRRRQESVIATWRPRIHEDDLRFPYERLSTFTTRFPAYKRNRTSNLKLATERLRGALIMPGETFSFNQKVGERTRATGYLVAAIFVNNEVVPGIGGGVCQVSTTLYNALRKGDFKIVERHKHSLPVTYVAPGRDATVSYPYRDLKFLNNTPNPVYVDGWVSGNTLTVELWGSRTRRGGASHA